MAAALAEPAEVNRLADTEDQTATRVYRIPERQPSAGPEAQVQPVPKLQPAADDTVLRPSPATNQPNPAEGRGRW